MKRNPKEYNKHKKEWCECCGGTWPMLDIDHVKTFGSGGSNEAYNCMTLCRFCHIEKGSIGLVSFAKKYPTVKNWLISNQWEFISGKWLYPLPQDKSEL